MTVLTVAPRQFEFETPALDCIEKKTTSQYFLPLYKSEAKISSAVDVEVNSSYFGTREGPGRDHGVTLLPKHLRAQSAQLLVMTFQIVFTELNNLFQPN